MSSSLSPAASNSPGPGALSRLVDWGGVTSAIAELVPCSPLSAHSSIRCLVCSSITGNHVFSSSSAWQIHLDTPSHVDACCARQLDRFGNNRTPRMSPQLTPRVALPIDPTFDTGADQPPFLRAYFTNQSRVQTLVETFVPDAHPENDATFAAHIRQAVSGFSRAQVESLVVHLASRLVTEMQHKDTPAVHDASPVISAATPLPRYHQGRPSVMDAFTLDVATAPPSCEMRGMPPPAMQSADTLRGLVPARMDALPPLAIPASSAAAAVIEVLARQSSVPNRMLSFKHRTETDVTNPDADAQSESTDEDLREAQSPHRNDFSMSTSAAIEDDGTFATLNDYVMLDPIGKGTTGEVIKASKGNTYYAIKRIDRTKVREAHVVEPGADPRQATISEVHALSRLHHRHIVRVVECIDDPTNKEVFLVMEYVNGGAVAKVNQNNGSCDTVEVSELRQLCAQMACALVHIHDNDMCHGDIKPDNILVARGDGNSTSPGTSTCNSNWQSPAATPLHSFVSPSRQSVTPTTSPRRSAFLEGGPLFLLADFGVASAVNPVASPTDYQSFRQSDSDILVTSLERRMPDVDTIRLPLSANAVAKSSASPKSTRTVSSSMPTIGVSSLDSSTRRIQSERTYYGSAENLPLMTATLSPGRPRATQPAGSFSVRSTVHSWRLSPQLDRHPTNNNIVTTTTTNSSKDVSDDDDDEHRETFAKHRGRVTAVGGTCCFDAPELFDGAPRTRASDMYALGASLYAMLVGRVPFYADSWAVLKKKVQTEAVTFPAELANRRSGDEQLDLLCDVILNLLNKNPEERMNSRALFKRTREHRLLDSSDSGGGMVVASSSFEPQPMPRPLLPENEATPNAPLAERGLIARSKLPDRLRRHVAGPQPSKASHRMRGALRDSSHLTDDDGRVFQPPLLSQRLPLRVEALSSSPL